MMSNRVLINEHRMDLHRDEHGRKEITRAEGDGGRRRKWDSHHGGGRGDRLHILRM